MPFFASFTIKLLPLYLNIFLGYIAGKKLKINQEAISRLMFYIISPLIIFNGVLHTKLTATTLLLPMITFLISCLICIVFYRLSRKIWTDSSKNIMAFSAGSGATGYFGIPLAMILLDAEMQGIYIMALLGVSLYDNTLGYYISVRGSHTFLQSLYKVLCIPTLYAFILALLCNYFQLPLPDFFAEFIHPIKGVYVVLGMMIVGLGFANLDRFRLDYKFIAMTFLAKFLIWPAAIFLVIGIDQSYFLFFDSSAYQVLFLLSIVPLAVNSVVMASLIDSKPSDVATTVLLSAIFAIVYIPLMASLFFTL
jgi:malate permease and related proteins